MSMERFVLPALAALGLSSVGYISYRYYTDTKRHNIRSKISPPHKGSVPRNLISEHQKISAKTLSQIQDVENRFFTGVFRKCALNECEFQKVKSAARSIGCRTEDAGNLEQLLLLMRNSGTLRPSNYRQEVSNVFAKAEVTLKDDSRKHLQLLEETVNDLMAQDLLEQYDVEQDDNVVYDAVLLYAEKDDSLAKGFYEVLKDQVMLQNFKVGLQDDFGHSEGVIQGWEPIYEKSIYLFVLVSRNFITDNLKRFVGEAALLKGLRDDKTRWRLIPVWMESEVLEHGICPFELSVIQGIKYYCYLQDQNDIRCFRSIERLITNGRKRYQEDYCNKYLID